MGYSLNGLKMVIVSSCGLGGILAHYGFNPSLEWWSWYRADISWYGNVAIYLNLVLLTIGFLRTD